MTDNILDRIKSVRNLEPTLRTAIRQLESDRETLLGQKQLSNDDYTSIMTTLAQLDSTREQLDAELCKQRGKLQAEIGRLNSLTEELQRGSELSRERIAALESQVATLKKPVEPPTASPTKVTPPGPDDPRAGSKATGIRAGAAPPDPAAPTKQTGPIAAVLTNRP